MSAPTDPFPLDDEASAWVEETLANLTLEQRVGQMIFTPIPRGVADEPDTFWEMAEEAQRIEVGGHILSGPSAGMLVPLINELQRQSDIPRIFCADFEAGVGHVWDDATRMPRQMPLAATGDPESARLTGEITAREALAAGVHWLLVPIADVNINPSNPIINIRSYGENVGTVSRFVTAFIEGAQGAGAMACAKHFPGHGDTVSDSHLELASVEADRERLDTVELPPFQAAIDAGVTSVMTSHIYFPTLMGDEGRIPATISHRVTTDLLRGEMGFEGIVTTDSMRMNGITDMLEPGEAAVQAVIAGVDVILISEDPVEAQRALVQAVRDGRISEERIAQSAERILNAKAWLGLQNGAIVDPRNVPTSLRQPDAIAASLDLTRRSITVIRNDGDLLPIDPSEIESVAHIALFDTSNRWYPGVVEPLTAGLQERFASVTEELVFSEPDEDVIERFATLDEDVSERELERTWGLTDERREAMLAMAEQSDLTVISAFVRTAGYQGSISIGEEEVQLINDLSARAQRVVLIAQGSPYMVLAVPDVPCQVITYDYSSVTSSVLSGALTGEQPITGTLPVTLPGVAEFGDGIQLSARE